MKSIRRVVCACGKRLKLRAAKARCPLCGAELSAEAAQSQDLPEANARPEPRPSASGPSAESIRAVIRRQPFRGVGFAVTLLVCAAGCVFAVAGLSQADGPLAGIVSGLVGLVCLGMPATFLYQHLTRGGRETRLERLLLKAPRDLDSVTWQVATTAARGGLQGVGQALATKAVGDNALHVLALRDLSGATVRLTTDAAGAHILFAHIARVRPELELPEPQILAV